DIGTRAFLPYLPKNLGSARDADLGCGNGVLAIASALENPQAHYTLVDESYMAVQSVEPKWTTRAVDREGLRCTARERASAARVRLPVVSCYPLI
ncbi:methyltransferase, partial [Pseudomonas viridiflava]|uniref:methyltransferase n=1 Tax=Pseudomonas viridiflava TaxID=33069 RepID=UPI001F07B316